MILSAPLMSIMSSISVAIIGLIATYIMVKPALDMQRSNQAVSKSEVDKNESISAATLIEASQKIRDMAKDLYETRIADMEQEIMELKKEKDIDSKKISKLERTIIEQFSVILRLLGLLKEGNIPIPDDLKAQVEKLIPPASQLHIA